MHTRDLRLSNGKMSLGMQHMRVPGSGCTSPKDIDSSWEHIQAAALRSLVLSGHARPDGRGFKDARQPSSRVITDFFVQFKVNVVKVKIKIKVKVKMSKSHLVLHVDSQWHRSAQSRSHVSVFLPCWLD